MTEYQKRLGRVHTRLNILYWTMLLIAAAVYVAFDIVQVQLPYCLPQKTTLFTITTVMTLLTLILMPVGLKLMKFKRVSSSISSTGVEGVGFWGSVRIACIGIPMVVNTILYYLFAHDASFGYLAVLGLLCHPFFRPTKSRIEAEAKAGQEDEKAEKP